MIATSIAQRRRAAAAGSGPGSAGSGITIPTVCEAASRMRQPLADNSARSPALGDDAAGARDVTAGQPSPACWLTTRGVSPATVGRDVSEPGGPMNQPHLIVNPLSGQQIVIRRTAAETDGQLLASELRLGPGGR